MYGVGFNKEMYHNHLKHQYGVLKNRSDRKKKNEKL